MENVYKHTGWKDWENGLFYENVSLLLNQIARPNAGTLLSRKFASPSKVAIIDETLPDVAQFRDVTIIKRRISFQGFQSYRDFGNILKEKNLEVEIRFVNHCVIKSGVKQTESLAAACLSSFADL